LHKRPIEKFKEQVCPGDAHHCVFAYGSKSGRQFYRQFAVIHFPGFFIGFFDALFTFGFSFSGLWGALSAPRNAASNLSWASFSEYFSSLAIGVCLMASNKRNVLPVDTKVAGIFNATSDLPRNIFEGIGRVVSAHALLENAVSKVLFDLMRVDYPEGRVAFGYSSASKQFSAVMRLIELHGIKPEFKLSVMKESIEACCTARDQLAHGLWIERSGILCLTLTKGTYSTAEGDRSREILPEGAVVHPGYFLEQQHAILVTTAEVQELQNAVKSLLQTLPDRSDAQ
jgi:hypothetical protein